MQAYFNRTNKTRNSGQETATTTDKQQLKHRGLNTNANKLNKITRGVANQKHLERLINKKNYKGLQNTAQNRK